MIDAHCHLSDPRLATIQDEVIAGLKASGVSRVILGGVNADDWSRQDYLLKRHSDFVMPVMGIHPWTVRDVDDAELESMFRTLEQKSMHVPFLGEIGLDFYLDNSPGQKERQARWCERQLRLAAVLNKPVVLHVVRGHDMMLDILKSFRGPRGCVHGFTAGADVARRYLDLGFVLSLGERSFRNKKTDDFNWLGQKDFVVESDAPGGRHPITDASQVVEKWVGSLRATSRFLAAIWNCPEPEIWARSRENLTRNFGISLT